MISVRAPKAAASILIVSYNSVAHLLCCFERLAAQTLQNFEVSLIKNGSNDLAALDTDDLPHFYTLSPKKSSANTRVYNAYGHIMPVGYKLRFPVFEKA
jgi:glycosyltransferase involved in cell wall biosynthesis